MDKVRFATIGTSFITERFLAAASACEAFEYAGAYSRDAAMAREFGGSRGARVFFDDLDALAASDDIDAVYIASPNALHVPQALRMIAGGKHVLVEKAFASNQAQAATVFSAARDRGVIAMEAMRSIHDPGFAVVRGSLPSLGVPRAATLRFAKVSSRTSKLLAGELPPIFDPRLAGGALMDIGIYCVEALVFLFGAPERVLAAGDVVDVPGIDMSDPCHRVDVAGEALAVYDGMVANVSFGKVADDHIPSQIEGERATLLVDKVSDPRDVRLVTPVKITGAWGTGEGEERRLDVPDLPNNMGCELEDFVASVRGREAPYLSAADAERVTTDSLGVMDEIRRQMGVVFPVDAE